MRAGPGCPVPFAENFIIEVMPPEMQLIPYDFKS
ncbi:hypothetical protein AIGOOFII_4247 [Methylobacterium marchantiae]|nr:hypothetical protein AIGOOFII_4247 [Methylobacterium marchantiae]